MQTFRKTPQQDSNGLIIHVSSFNDRSTEVVTHDRIRVGTTDDCEVKVRLSKEPATPTNDPVIELVRLNGIYRIESFNPALDVKLNGRPIKANKGIYDGDEIWIGPSGPSIHFFPIESTAALVPGRRDGAHVAPFIEQAAMEASATSRRDDAKIFLREFTRELVREINPSTKIITFAILIVAVLGALYIGFGLYNEVRRTRRANDELRAQTAAAIDQVARTNQKLTQLDQSNKEVIRSLSLAVQLRSDYGKGVCLIAGSFMFVEPGTGRPLRYPETKTNESGGTIENSNESSSLTPEGSGAIAEFPFAATGFHVGDGFV